MRIEPFALERYQSIWENRVAWNVSESGVHPLRVAELVDSAGAHDALLQAELGYPQTNGTPELREAIAALYPGAGAARVQVTNGGSEANCVLLMRLVEPGDELVVMMPNYMQVPGLARALGAIVRPWWLREVRDGEQVQWRLDLDELNTLITPRTRAIVVCNPNNPTGARLDAAILDGLCRAAERVGAWVIGDEIYRGAERIATDTPSVWQCGYARRVVTSGLSKAYGIPGVRIGWLVGPPRLTAECWTQHDYVTIGPNKMSDRIARVAVEAGNRERCYARTGAILRHNLPIAREWVTSFGGRLTWTEPVAGAIGLMKYAADTPSLEIADRVRARQSTLLVPGTHVGIEGHLRIWLGGNEAFLREGLRRIGAELAAVFD